MIRTCIMALLLLLSVGRSEAKLPDIDSHKAMEVVHQMMKIHALYHQMTPELMKRVYSNYLDELDPNKTYFIKSEIEKWISPSDAFLTQSVQQFDAGNFSQFFAIRDAMVKAIDRRHQLEKEIDYNNLPKKVNADEFKDMQWVSSEKELLTRLERIKALQIETSAKLAADLREKALQRIQKHQTKVEDEIIDNDPKHRDEFILSLVLKATASALDAHTTYFTPDEAEQFLINVQQRLFGIGAQLRDDLNGFTVVKIIDGGPASRDKELKVKDRIVAVNKEPVVGMDITDAVDLIRGKEGTQVMLTVIRDGGEKDEKKEGQHDITITRGEVVLKESRYETSYEPYGDGAIGYVRLFSFYQDRDSSSTKDLAAAIEKLKKEHHLEGLILDLRYNTGGMLSQAVGVTGLFITKGVVVAIKDEEGNIQYLRDIDGKTIWNGPLIILENRASASASEIVSQTLQDYGKALVVGDATTYGKGTFQTFSLNSTKDAPVNPEGEFKVTRGVYYTVSGKTPQLTGVKADIVVPGPLSEMEIGESYAKFPLPNDSIKPNFDDDLSDMPISQRRQISALYRFNLQPKLTTYQPYLEMLKKNSAYRIENNKSYQAFLKEIKKDNTIESETETQVGQNDLQLTETYNIMKDLLKHVPTSTKTAATSS